MDEVNYIDIVEELNQTVYNEETDDTCLCRFEYKTNGSSHIIQWDGLTVFDSEESDLDLEDHDTIIKQVIQEFEDVRDEIAKALGML